MWRDPELLWLVGGIVGLLAAATLVGQVLRRTLTSAAGTAVVANLNARIATWWLLMLVFVAASSVGHVGAVLLFGISSFLALREFVTLTRTDRADHMALFWSFFVVLPLQYYLVYIKWYGVFAIFIPVYAFIFLPIRLVLAGETAGFLRRAAQLQWGVLVCVYFISHVPALLMLDIRDYAGQNVKLLFFFATVVQLNDVFQYVWGKLLGRRKIVPKVSPNKTWEGFVGGALTAAAVGAALAFVTPFSVWQAALFALAIALMGFAGDVTLSAVKRDAGVKDFSEALPGHGGVLDRFDSTCFAAPIFFHLTRFFFVNA